MHDDLTPVLIGAGQLTQRDAEPAEALPPVDLMAQAARHSAADAGVSEQALSRLDTVAVVNVIGWNYANAPRLLSERLQARPATELYTPVGGNTPQFLVNEMARRIAAGKSRFALIAGAEAVRTLQRARAEKVALDWASGGEGRPQIIGEDRIGTNDHEMAHGLVLPTSIYPLFENALRAHNGLAIDVHRRRLGELCSRMSAVAADNPYAWFRTARSAEEISAVTAENRMIGFPYPKYMNAIINVDQSAAVLMTSAAEARRLGVPPQRCVYLHGAAAAHDLWHVSERVNFHTSPAIRATTAAALEAAGKGVQDIDFFDLYSCFPCAVQIARDMLRVAADDPRSLTVTGGLPYHGGPGNNYSTHAIATMMDKLRAQPGTFGLVTALGWYLTKHSVGVYSAQPTTTPAALEAPALQQDLDAAEHPPLRREASGPATIETYTVLHDKDGMPMRGIVVGRLQDGARFLANTPADRAVLEGLMAAEAVGRPGVVATDGDSNRFDPA
jgi:acetyl-CoA C-acetyltransferase